MFAVHCKHMQIGRQEDAHECLRYLVDLMQKASLFGKGKWVLTLQMLNWF